MYVQFPFVLCRTGGPCSPDGSGHDEEDEEDSAGEDEGEVPVDLEDGDGDIHDPFSREGDVTLNSSTGQVDSETNTSVAPGHITQEGSGMKGRGPTDSPLQSRPGHFDEFTEQSPPGHVSIHNITPATAGSAPAAPGLDVQIQLQESSFYGNHHHSSPHSNHPGRLAGYTTSAPPSVVVGGSNSRVLDQGSPVSSIASSAPSSSYGENRVRQFSPSPSTSSHYLCNDNDTPDHHGNRDGLHKDIGNHGDRSKIANLNRNNHSGEEPMCLKRKLFTIDSIIGITDEDQRNHLDTSCTGNQDQRTHVNECAEVSDRKERRDEEGKEEKKRERDIFDQIPSPPPKITDIEKLKARELSYMSYPHPASYAYLAGRQVGQINPAYAASLAAVREGHPALSSAVPLGGPCYQFGGSLALPAGLPYTLPGSPYMNTAQLLAYQHAGVSSFRGPIELSHSPNSTIKLESRDLQAK